MVVNFYLRYEPSLFLVLESIQDVNNVLITARSVALGLIEKEIEAFDVSRPRLESDLFSEMDKLCKSVNDTINSVFNESNTPVQTELEWYTIDNYTLTLRTREGKAPMSNAIH